VRASVPGSPSQPPIILLVFSPGSGAGFRAVRARAALAPRGAKRSLRSLRHARCGLAGALRQLRQNHAAASGLAIRALRNAPSGAPLPRPFGAPKPTRASATLAAIARAAGITHAAPPSRGKAQAQSSGESSRKVSQRSFLPHAQRSAVAEVFSPQRQQPLEKTRRLPLRSGSPPARARDPRILALVLTVTDDYKV